MWSSYVYADFLFCSARIAVVAAAKKELNNRVCVSSCVWVEYCCLLHYHLCCPSPLTSYSSNCGQREREEEEGVRGKKGRGRENE